MSAAETVNYVTFVELYTLDPGPRFGLGCRLAAGAPRGAAEGNMNSQLHTWALVSQSLLESTTPASGALFFLNHIPTSRFDLRFKNQLQRFTLLVKCNKSFFGGLTSAALQQEKKDVAVRSPQIDRDICDECFVAAQMGWAELNKEALNAG